MVRHYGYCSNVARGKRQQKGLDDAIPYILEPQGNEKAFRKNWARLIQKIYEIDPLVCPKLVPAKAGMSRGHADYQFHDHRHRTPHFVANISLRYKSVLLILPPSKSNALSKNLMVRNRILS